jgi:cell division protein FtsL
MNSPIDSSVKIRPFSSDTDKDKQDLLQDADIYRDKLEHQWSDLKTEATGFGKQALVIGGVVATTYLVMNALLPKSKKTTEESQPEELVLVEKDQFKKHKSQSSVGQAIQSIAWTLAVGWARKKLKHIIEDERKTE